MVHPHKEIRYIITLSLFLVLTLLLIQVAYSATQKTFTLDLDDPVFRYEEYNLNGSIANDLTYNTSENKTLVMTIPKNSTILDSNMTLTGKVTPSQTTGTGVSYYCVAVGNVTGGSKEDIAIGASTSPHVYFFNSSLNQLWNFSTGGKTNSIAIGDVSQDSKEDVVIGSQDKKVYLLNSSGIELWNYDVKSIVNSVAVGNITLTDKMDVVIGANNGTVYVLNSSGQIKWTSTPGSAVHSVAGGDVKPNVGDEIAVGEENGLIYLLNSTSDEIWNSHIGSIIYSLAIGKITNDQGQDIVAGAENGTVYVLNSSGQIKWSYDVPSGSSYTVWSVAIGDITSDTGNEIALGSQDHKVYVLNSSGSLIWTFTTDDEVRGVDVGDVTTDPLNETVAVSIDKKLYILNFEYYPTPYIDIGGDGDWDWSYPEKLRVSVSVSNSSLAPGIQDYISTCTPDANGNCEVPFIFYSASAGELEVSNINITYDYNASSVISHQHQTNTWSRTAEVWVNETVGYEVENISYGNPANTITINYIKINETATKCDFNGNTYNNITIDGINYCNIGSDSVASGQSRLLWDNSMDTSIPVYSSETSPVTTPEGVWKKNVTIWNNTKTVFTNVIANATLNYSLVVAGQNLYVEWFSNGTFYDITPSTTCPSYDSKQIGSDTFSVCRDDKFGSDGIVDYFQWKQPHTSTKIYEVRGSTNHPANLTNLNVTPYSGIWGAEFNFTVNVSDSDGDNVTVNLWVYLADLDAWEKIGSKNTTTLTNETPETLKFTVSSNKSWTGNNKFRFQYRDFLGSYVYHDWEYTDNSTGPSVTRHNASIIYVQGNNTKINRTGSASTLLIIGVNDTDEALMVGSGVNCAFWLTKDGTNFVLVHATMTNSSGYCNYSFNPDSTYSVGKQWWLTGTYQDSYYLSQNSTNFTSEVYGQLNINLTKSVVGKNFTRTQNIESIAKIYDDNGNVVQIEGYNCTWYVKNETGSLTQTGNSTTNSSGYCNYTWSTGCSDDLGSYNINVSLWGSVSEYYYIWKDYSETDTTLKDNLNITIIYPTSGYIIHELETLMLNSTVFDQCGSPEEVYNVNWYFPGTGGCSGNISSGPNTTYSLSIACTPRTQVLIANASGNLYNTGEDQTSIYIYGWSRVSVIKPTSNSDINRSKEGESYNIICLVEDANNSLGVGKYPVNFWYVNESSYVKSIGVNITNVTIGSENGGYAIYLWDISNETVPDGYYNLTCNITDNSTLFYNASKPESLSYDLKVFGNPDIIPPQFVYVNTYSAQLYDNVTIESRIKDFYGVDKVWLNITHPNKTTSSIFPMVNTSSDLSDSIWNTSLNLTKKGDYDFIIYANDTSNLTNSTTGWVEVYLPIQFYGSAKNAIGNNVSINFTFYKSGTNRVIHNFLTETSNAEYNETVHERIYDIETGVFDHKIKLISVNISNDTANSVSFDNFGKYLVQITGVRNRLIGLAMETTLNFTTVNITLNYSSALGSLENPSRFYEPGVDIYQCSDWNFSQRICTSDNWINLGGVVDYLKSNTVSINLSSLSGFVVGDTATPGDGICDSGESCANEPACCGGDTGNGGTPTGPSGGDGGISPRCGNDICEAGENVYNCPEDCGYAETMFSLRTNLTNVQIDPGQEKNYGLWIKNNVKYDITTSISVVGTASNFITLETTSLDITTLSEKLVNMYLRIPDDVEPSVYTGDIIVTADGKTESIPISITVSLQGTAYLDVVVEAMTKIVGINDTAKFHVMLYNLGFRKRLNLDIEYLIKDFKTEKIIHQENESKTIQTSESFVKNIPLHGINLTAGQYIFETKVKYDSRVITATDDFEVTTSFWTTERMTILMIITIGASSTIAFIYGRKRYIAWKLAKARYIFPMDMDKLPKGEIWLGKIAETKSKSYFSMDDLTTHVLTAGATGSGKSVSAMVFVEELLEEKIPVIIFDPTAQWTGFVRPCRDPKLIRYYKEFGLNTRDTRSYNGMIYEVTDPKVKIDFKKYMNPGEITIFTLNKLKPGQYDDAVRNIIDTIFEQGWEESTKLKMVIVFDEVHRLLEKYGGKGGYVSLEKACREFRKWGIGLIMASQVLSDFKEAIKGNVLTEVQLHTKSLGDLKRIETKYGLEYAKKVTRQEVGIGMMQNPKYNEGRPWFVSFRPTIHSPHKIPDADMNTYREYASLLEMIESRIGKMEKSGKDVFDLKTELKLAKDKLKKGRFRMAKIYIDSLNKHLSEG